MKMRGSSLVKDLEQLINNPIYSDLRIISEDNVILYGCRSILAARSAEKLMN
ncbi:4418_t:CDS:2 [Diversispora eburnea]|uniref:4418_t:CDS:1 n=1 Tax=Diversispora eburnea TaxID=1213867 RepID=A0A9N9A8B5_9GLOM|nr:4418_t:CDS:2 [Diversispora eburnea]